MKRAPRVCSTPGCPELVSGSARYCVPHMRERRPADTRPSSARRGYDAQWQKIRAAYLAAHPWCSEPGTPPHPAAEVDHIIAIKDGGTNDWINLRSYCHQHHSRRTAQDQPGGWNKRLRANVGGEISTGG